jgi:uncharacterized DUF497 family protein
VEFEWDESKNQSNQLKHGVSFEEASELFSQDVETLEIFDELHSELEDRFISIGPIKRGLVLVVWTERDADIVRIISARWATARESQKYHAYLKDIT